MDTVAHRLVDARGRGDEGRRSRTEAGGRFGRRGGGGQGGGRPLQAPGLAVAVESGADRGTGQGRSRLQGAQQEAARGGSIRDCTSGGDRAGRHGCEERNRAARGGQADPSDEQETTGRGRSGIEEMAAAAGRGGEEPGRATAAATRGEERNLSL
jgi:hypothetical protein